jgi:hypothetical protein
MHVGATITLSNTYCTTYEVIGVNHDGTTGTVDIMAHTQVGNQQFNNGYAAYQDSSLRTWINGTYFNAFSANIRNVSKDMTVITVGKPVTTDKVKILSMAEIGATHSYAPTAEGSLYEGVFTRGASSTVIANRWRDAGTYGSTDGYWLRTGVTNDSSKTWHVRFDTYCSSLDEYSTRGILPVLRF